MECGLNFIAVDVGNTSTAIGLWASGKVTRVSHCDGSFNDAARVFDKLLSSLSKGSLNGVAYVSVVPEKDKKWAQHAKKRKLPFHVVSWQKLKSPKLDYPKPETIGADRLADAAAAVDLYGTGVVIMDFGTALTAAVVTDDGIWRGGAIAPGFPLMSDYLFERTAKLPKLKLTRFKEPKIGRSTQEAMLFGITVGYRGMVREIVSTLEANFKQKLKLVATGGYAQRVLEGLDIDFVIDKTLTLYGTGLICSQKH